MQFLIDVALSLVYLGAFFMLWVWSWRFWKMYVNQKHLNSLEWVLLEIKLPREIFKSPLAMETVLLAFLQSGGVGHWYAREFKGALPAYGSLEIASLEGILHFYIRIQPKFRPLIESSMYAQYPGVEIVEADDYTQKIRYTHLVTDKVHAWGSNYVLANKWKPVNEKTGENYKDPTKKGEDLSMKADFYPIKTYVDYGLDKDPKEEFKTDPMVQLLEFMGGIGKGEYYWYQIILQDESVYDGKKFPQIYVNDDSHEHWSLADMAKRAKKQLRTSHYLKKNDPFMDDFGDPKEKKSGKKDADGKDIMIPALYKETKAVGKKEMELTPEEKDELEAINMKMSKPLVLGVVRLMYVVDMSVGKFNSAQIQNILAYTKPYAGWNKFAPQVTDPYDYPWQDIGEKRNMWRTEEKFEAFVEREGFFPHIPERKGLDRMEDMIFWSSSMATRRTFRMIYEAIFHPFSHPAVTEVSTYNLEEIATMWHLPGQVASIPTLPRIGSAKGVAPVNLPQ